MRKQLLRCALAVLVAGASGMTYAVDPFCGHQGGYPRPLTCSPASPPGAAAGDAGTGATDPYGQGMTGNEGQNPSGADGQQPAAGGDDFSGLGGDNVGYNNSIIAFGGLGISSASATGNVNFMNLPANTSLISPGLLTASTVQTTLPSNRIFGGYGYYDAFQVTSIVPPTTAMPATSRGAGFNLHTYNIGIEKTLFCGNASVYAQIPFLSASQNTTSQNINGIGDVSVGFKALLCSSSDNRRALSAGLTVATPTANSGQFLASQTINVGPGGSMVTSSSSIRVNPTIIQPWVSGMATFDRLSVQNYFGVLIPTDNTVVTSANENLSIGYRIWECEHRTITSISRC